MARNVYYSNPSGLKSIEHTGKPCSLTGWHIGNYAPYRKRATLHDGVWNPVARQWVRDWFDRMRKLQEEKLKTA